jgi:hypothetical protein
MLTYHRHKYKISNLNKLLSQFLNDFQCVWSEAVAVYIMPCNYVRLFHDDPFLIKQLEIHMSFKQTGRHVGLSEP